MINSPILTEFRFTKTTLSNGLDVIVRHQPLLPLVAVNLWYHVGSKNEERNQRGLTHLVEHLMFEGTAQYPGDYFKHLRELGANINGSTSSDRTNYFVDLPAAHFEKAMAMESDRMGCLVDALTEPKLAVQKDVVKNEYRQNYPNKPYGRVWPIIAEALYPPQHPYSWLTIGVMEDIDRATLQDVAGFLRRYYVPGNASLAVVGDVGEELGLALAKRYFEPIGGGTSGARPWVPENGLAANVSIVLHDRVELDRLYLVWPTTRHFQPDEAALVLLADVLGLGKSGRLYRKLVIEQEVAQDISVYQSSRELAGSFGIIVTLRPAQTSERAASLIHTELSAIAAEGVEETELRRVQSQRVAGFLFALEHMGGFGGVADRLNAYNIFCGDPALITVDVRRFQNVTLAQVRDVAQRYLCEQPRVELSVVGRGKTSGRDALDRSAVPAGSGSLTYRPPQPQRIVLGCGIPLWFFPRRDLPTVAGTIAIPGGASLQQPWQEGLAEITMAMLDEGTAALTAAEIALAAESMGAIISASCGWDGSYVSFRCLRGDLARSLDLTTEILLRPTFPEPEFQRVRGQTMAALQAERDSAESRAHRAFLSAIYSENHPYRVPLAGTRESVAALTRTDLAQFHERFLIPGAATIVVAGDVDPNILADELDRRLTSLRGPATCLPDLPACERAPAARILVIDRPGASQAVLKAGHLGIARCDPAYEALLVLNQILGGQFSSRLNEKLREQRGLTYGIRSVFDCRRQPGPFSINAAVQTDRIAEALDEVHQELESLTGSRPPSQSELELARRSLVEGHPRHFETPSALVNRLVTLAVAGLPPDHDVGFAERLAAIDLDALIASAQYGLHPHSLVAVVVADAARVCEDLNRLEWARVDVVDDVAT
jgi:predicted Zn-dependent peptidase